MQNTRRYTAEEVHYTLDSSLQAGQDATWIIIQALAKVPARVVDKLSDRCMILVPAIDEARGMHVTRSMLKGRDVIALTENICGLPPEEAERIVLHEVSHFWLKHRAGVNEDMSIEDVERQEKEADDLALKWINQAGF